MKKVLISLGELQDLLKASYHECCWKDGIPEFTNEHAIKWFDAQPDISDAIADSVKEGLKNARESFIKAALSKMETTGGKDDN